MSEGSSSRLSSISISEENLAALLGNGNMSNVTINIEDE
jgi:hypothetical protein